MRWESHQAFYERFRRYGLHYEALTTCYAIAENVFAITQGGIQGQVVVDEIDRDSLQNDRIARPPLNGKATIKMLSAGLSAMWLSGRWMRMVKMFQSATSVKLL